MLPEFTNKCNKNNAKVKNGDTLKKLNETVITGRTYVLNQHIAFVMNFTFLACMGYSTHKNYPDKWNAWLTVSHIRGVYWTWRNSRIVPGNYAMGMGPRMFWKTRLVACHMQSNPPPLLMEVDHDRIYNICHSKQENDASARTHFNVDSTQKQITQNEGW